MANENPNFKPMLDSIEERTKRLKNNVDNALRELVKRQEKINFNAVAKIAGVSKAFLYKHDDLRQRIEQLRKQQEGLANPKDVKRTMTEPSKDVMIASLKRRVKELENENKQLNERLQVRLGEFYSKI